MHGRGTSRRRSVPCVRILNGLMRDGMTQLSGTQTWCQSITVSRVFWVRMCHCLMTFIQPTTCGLNVRCSLSLFAGRSCSIECVIVATMGGASALIHMWWYSITPTPHNTFKIYTESTLLTIYSVGPVCQLYVHVACIKVVVSMCVYYTLSAIKLSVQYSEMLLVFYMIKTLG